MANIADLQLIQIGDFPETETMAGSGAEYIVLRKADGTTYRMRTSDFVEEIGISGPSSMGGVVPDTSYVPDMGSVESPAIYFAGPGVYPGFGGITLTEPLNVISWDGVSAVAKGVPIEVPPAENKINEWVAGTYTEGEQRMWEGQIWSVKDGVETTIEEPGAGDDWVEDIDKVSSDDPRLPFISPSPSDLYYFTDANGAIVGTITKDGLFDFLASDKTRDDINLIKKTNDELVFALVDSVDRVLFGVGESGEYLIPETSKQDINNVKKVDIPGFIYVIVDSLNRVVFSIDDNGDIFPSQSSSDSNFSSLLTGHFPNRDSEPFLIKRTSTIAESISLPTVAVGRESAEGANDAPTISITNSGLCHPSVVHIPGGWGGFEYWMAFTPTFGIIPGNEYENPHIMSSHDGINWQEPVGISNPIDLPPPSPSTGYWSDTHLRIGSDGYMHLWYRGNNVILDGVSYGRVVVHRKSRDGVNFSDRRVVFSTNDEGLTSNNLIVSQAFNEIGAYWHCWDGLRPAAGGLQPVGDSKNNSTDLFVMHRVSKSADSDFEPYTLGNVVNLVNRPWGIERDIWHLDVCKYGNVYFLLAAVGSVGISGSASLWIGTSSDGWNFNMINTPILETAAYRSCMVVKESASGEIAINIYIGKTGLGLTGGKMELKEIILTK